MKTSIARASAFRRTRGARRSSRLPAAALCVALFASIPLATFARDRSETPGHTTGGTARGAELRETSALGLGITFPAANAVIDQGTTAMVPINLSVTSGTPLESLTITVCEAQNGTVCTNQFSAPSQFTLAPAGPYQAMWTPANVSAAVATSLKYMVWAAARNTAGEIATTAAVAFTYVYLPARATKLLAPTHDVGFFAPASPVLWASMTLLGDDHSTVDHVDFLDGTSVIGSVSTPNSLPQGYAYLWTNAAAGAHEVWARGVDSMGHAMATPSVSIYIVPPPGAINVTLEQPRSGEVYGTDVPIPLRATAGVTEGGIVRVEYVDGATVIATSLAPPYQATWNTPSIGNHAITARAFDDLGNARASGSAYVQTLSAPRPPIVVLAAPKQGSTTALKAPIAFSSIAESPDVAISRIDYWVDGNLIASSATAPYSYSWTTAGLGAHSIAAVVYDVMAHKTQSEVVKFNVTADGKPPTGGTPPPPPQVTITTPVNNATFVEGNDVHLTATASQSGGTIARVDFVANDKAIATSTAPPWTATWVKVAPGSYGLKAIATNNGGVAGSSSVVNIQVTASPTTITMAAPA
ncbi:MAG: Ig-like domain-containing protein, partial [Betaproteobacteria bacterium]